MRITFNNLFIVYFVPVEHGVDIRKSVSPVCLPDENFNLSPGTPVTIAGWGATGEDGPVINTLQEVDVEVTEPRKCQETYLRLAGAKIGENILCAGIEEGGKDSCQGDSGGPLVVEMNDGTFVLVGVISAGMGCARRDIPGIYTKVSKHIKWIKKVQENMENN